VQVVGPTRYGRAQCAVGQVPVGDAVVAAAGRGVEFAHRGGIAEVDAGLTTGRGEQMVRQGGAGSDEAGEGVPGRGAAAGVRRGARGCLRPGGAWMGGRRGLHGRGVLDGDVGGRGKVQRIGVRGAQQAGTARRRATGADNLVFTGGGGICRAPTNRGHPMRHTIRGIALLFATGALLLLAGCVSPGGAAGYPGGYPGDYGQPDQGYPPQYGSQLQGTVDGLDPGYQRIHLMVDDPRSGRVQRVELRYDQRTRLFYRGRESAVEGLERGDVIQVDVAESGRELLVRSIEVVRNV